MSKKVFGIDIGGTTVKLGLFTMDGVLLDKWEIPTRTEEKGKYILSDIADSIKARCEQEGYTKEDIAGVGIGAPGPVKADGVIQFADNLGWGELSITDIMGELLGVPVKAANDANVAALGEMWQGGGQGFSDVVAVTLGTGVGGGVIIGGTLLAGSLGSAGEIGHINVESQEEESCSCGCKGCLEQYASATGVVRLAKKRLMLDGQPSVLRHAELSARCIWDAVKEGDAVAIEIAEQFGHYLGRGLASVAAVVNPEVFVIGGGVSKAGEILIEYMKPYFERYSFLGVRNVKFKIAKLGNDAGIYGAARLMIGGR